MGFFEDFWGTTGDVLSALPVGPTAIGYQVKKRMTEEDQPAAAAPAAPGVIDTRDAPVNASAEDKPKVLGYEDIPGFDPETDAPFMVVGGKKQKGRFVYYEGMERTDWSDMSEKQINKTKKRLYKAGYYGKDLPLMNGMPSTDDVDALKKAMTDANLAGGLDWQTYLQRRGNDPEAMDELNGGDGSGAGGARQIRADRAAAITTLRGFAYDNGVDLPRDFVRRQADRVARGAVSAEELQNQLVNKYLVRSYPAFTEELKAGMSVRDAAAPYIAQFASLLEVDEGSVDLRDPLMKRALQNVDEKGEVSPMPLWKFEEEIKKDKRWQYTDNAWEDVGSQAFEVMKMFGMA